MARMLSSFRLRRTYGEHFNYCSGREHFQWAIENETYSDDFDRGIISVEAMAFEAYTNAGQRTEIKKRKNNSYHPFVSLSFDYVHWSVSLLPLAWRRRAQHKRLGVLLLPGSWPKTKGSSCLFVVFQELNNPAQNLLSPLNFRAKVIWSQFLRSAARIALVNTKRELWGGGDATLVSKRGRWYLRIRNISETMVVLTL
jgi:hypothetical protein